MNNQHTFKIGPYPIREWLDPSVTTEVVEHFWQIKEYVNGEFRQLWGPFDSEMAAAQTVKGLAAYFNGRDMGMESLKHLVDLYKDIDVRMHAIYANVIHDRWAAFEQNWEGLQRELGQYLTVANSIREVRGGRWSSRSRFCAANRYERAGQMPRGRSRTEAAEAKVRTQNKEAMKKRMRLSRAARVANRKRRLFKRLGVVIEVIPNRKDENQKNDVTEGIRRARSSATIKKSLFIAGTRVSSRCGAAKGQWQKPVV
jgi:hypothetical protein